MLNKSPSRFFLTVIFFVAFISPTSPFQWFDGKSLSAHQLDNIQEGILASIERLIGPEDEAEMKAKYNANVEENKVKEMGKNWWDLLPGSQDIPLETVHYTPIKMRDGAYQMNQYRPESFLKFWKDILKIDLHMLKKSFAASRDDESKRMKPLGEHAGKSGQSLFRTHDHVWLVKTVSAPELLKLAEMAERYYQHWAEFKKPVQPSSSTHASSPTDNLISHTHSSLITIYMGCYTYVENQTEVAHIIVMKNLAPKLVGDVITIDIKGIIERTPEDNVVEKKSDEKVKSDRPNTFFRILGVKRKIQEVEVSSFEDIVDYSLLIVISKQEAKEHCSYNSFFGARRGDPNTGFRFQIRLAVIDTLIQYKSFMKMAESNIKWAWRYLTGSVPAQRTIVPPKDYYKRFLKFTIGDHEHDGHVVAKDVN